MNSEAAVRKAGSWEQEREVLEFKVKVLEAEVADLKRRMFGPKSEKIDPDQMKLVVEAEAQNAVLEEDEPAAEEPVPVATPRRIFRWSGW